MEKCLYTFISLLFILHTVPTHSITDIDPSNNCQYSSDILKCYIKTLYNIDKLFSDLSVLSDLSIDEIEAFSIECDELYNYRSRHGIRKKYIRLPNLKLLRIQNCDLDILGTIIIDNSILEYPRRISVEPDKAHFRNIFSNLTNLYTLDISNNYIMTLPINLMCPLMELKKLNLAHNKLSEISFRVPRLGRLSRHYYDCLPNIEVLDLSNNELNILTRYSLDGLRTLQELYLQNNGLYDIHNFAFSELYELRILDLSDNQLSMLTSKLFENTQLEQLILSDNLIMLLTPSLFKSLPNLNLLDLSNNKITGNSLHIEKSVELSNLDILDLSYNNIATLSNTMIYPIARLKNLNLTHNKLSEISLLCDSSSVSRDIRHNNDCLPHIQVLDLSYNNFTELPDYLLSGSKTLQQLYLQDNQINNIGGKAFIELTSLKILNLSNNRIDTLKPELFHNNHALQKLILSNNKLSILKPRIFESLSHLILLDISFNEITSYWLNHGVLSHLKDLTILILSHNSLNKVDTSLFSGLYKLRELYLEHNNIEVLPNDLFKSLSNLIVLKLSHNRIVNLDSNLFVDLISLKQLFLDGNNISNLQNNTFRNILIEDLSLTSNNLSHIPTAIRNSRSLRSLDAGDNKISHIDNDSFKGLNALIGLRLVDNKLKNITNDCFSTLSALQILNLGSNSIDNIEQNAFGSNSILDIIYINNNKLTEIGNAFINVSRLRILNLSYNKLRQFDYINLPRSIECLDLSYNQLRELIGSPGTIGDFKIKILNASYNNILQLDKYSIPRTVEQLYLNNNHIQSISTDLFNFNKNLKIIVLTNNNLKHISLSSLSVIIDVDYKMREVYISNNPIVCDCTMKWILPENEVTLKKNSVRIMDIDALQCYTTRDNTTLKPLSSLTSEHFLCRYETHCPMHCHCCDFDACDCEMMCPDNCSCYHDDTWSENIVDCSNNKHKTIPELIPMGATEIYLNGNNLTYLENHAFIGKHKLQKLYLNDNSITTLHNRTFNGVPKLRILHLENNALRQLHGFEFEQLEQLSELYLDHNAIVKVDNTTFKKMKSLEVLRLNHNKIVDFIPWEIVPDNNVQVYIALEGNPWNCDCETSKKLLLWIYKHRSNAIDITCQGDNSTVLDIFGTCRTVSVVGTNNHDIIFENSVIVGNYIPLLAGILVAIITVCLLIALIFVFRNDIKLWLHSHYGIRIGKIVHPPDEEHDRLYDGYIIYNERDQDFVSGCLSAELEQSGLTLCLHYRDLPSSRGYETLPSAASAAKRIVLVFSPLFITNEWHQPEFRAALRCAFDNIRPNARKRRIILLMVTELPRNDPELHLLMQTCEIIEWNDKRFWEKLRFSMPDPANKKPNGKILNSNSTCVSSRIGILENNIRIPARHPAALSQPGDLCNKPNGIFVAPIHHHAPTSTPTQSTYVSSASSRTEDEDSGAEHHQYQSGYSALHTDNGRPASLSSRSSHLYSTIAEPPMLQGPLPVNLRTYFV